MKAEACTFDPLPIPPKCRTSHPLRCKLRQTCKLLCNDAALSKHAASRWSCPWSKYSSAISPLQTVHVLDKTHGWRFLLVGRSSQIVLPFRAWSCLLYVVVWKFWNGAQLKWQVTQAENFKKCKYTFIYQIVVPRGPSVLEKRHPNWKDDVSAISTTNQEKVDDLQKSWRFESSTYPHTYPTIATTARWTSFVFSERRGSKTLVRWKRHRTIKMKLKFFW